MGEFVEQSLEELLPVYEQLERVQLFKPNEVRQVIKRCRRYEYRLHKQTKRPDDFVNYAEYMTDLLRLIKRRRKAINYFHKTAEIDNTVRNKAEALYRRCTHRFQDRLDIWLKRLSFAKYAKMRLTASKIYSSLLKVHGGDPKLWQDAANWEFTVNRSAVNARALLQQALRRFPQNRHLYLTLFDIE
uniref:U3 small nucleolar RNA-associated protein 6 n=2 Tax=Plectus sambesii TaxID=2011161 RepID=A0A914V5B0_9BILA